MGGYPGLGQLTAGSQCSPEDGRIVAQFIYTMYKVRKAHGDKVILDDVTLSLSDTSPSMTA